MTSLFNKNSNRENYSSGFELWNMGRINSPAPCPPMIFLLEIAGPELLLTVLYEVWREIWKGIFLVVNSLAENSL